MDGKDLLERIARTLGVPVSAFLDGRPILDGADEMLRLYSSIRDPADRRAVLEFVRALAERQALSAIPSE